MNWADRESTGPPSLRRTHVRLVYLITNTCSRQEKVEQMFAIGRSPCYFFLEHLFASEGAWHG